jgi:hypothetical protein
MLIGRALLVWVRSANLGDIWTTSACCVVIFIVCIVMIVSGDVIKQTTDLHYAPPITPDTLPADEILVRGSDEPSVVQSQVLLRAAKEQTRQDEQLLRGTDHAG